MDRWRRKVAVVIGACGGIGQCIVKYLINEDLHVVGIDNRFDQSDAQHTFKVDITHDEEVASCFKWISDNLGPVHILVNSAGVCQETTLIDGDIQKWKKVFDINVLGLCITTREAVKIMRNNNIDGHVVHIGSLAGHRVLNLPEVNVYPASKHAVRALTETLQQELCDFGLKIKVTCINPAKVNTSLLQNNDFSVDGKTTKIFEALPMIEPSDVADAVLYALSTPSHVQVHDLIITSL